MSCEWLGPTWACEALLEGGFLIEKGHTERIDGKRIVRRFAEIGVEGTVCDFIKWIGDVTDTHITVEFPDSGKKFPF